MQNHSTTLDSLRAQCAAAGIPTIRPTSGGTAWIVPSATEPGVEYITTPINATQGYCTCEHGQRRRADGFFAYCWHVKQAWIVAGSWPFTAPALDVVAVATVAAQMPAPSSQDRAEAAVADLWGPAAVATYTRRERRKERW